MAEYKHKFRLKDLLKDGEKIAKENKKEAAERIGSLALELIKEDLQRYRSPVNGTPFKQLKDKSYQKLKGTKKSNLFLHGDLYDGIREKSTTLGVTLEISGAKNKLKAENHLKLDNDGNEIPEAVATNVAQRKFFPVGEERLRPGILKKLREEIEDLID